MNNTNEEKCFLEFYAARSRQSSPVARIHIDRRGDIQSINPKTALSDQQKEYLAEMLAQKGQSPVYEQIFDFLVERGIEGSCGFSPEQQRVYFVSSGEDPINEFFGKK